MLCPGRSILGVIFASSLGIWETQRVPKHMPARALYEGTERKLVLAFDVGTTYSGISYTVLDPGREPKINPVTRFPERARAGGDAKVPTVIYYGPDGTLRSIGAQTEREGIDTLARDSQWNKAEWFKLHLRPRTRATTSVSDDIPPLPPGKTAVDVFADFLRYMKGCAKTYIEETHPVDGLDFWRSGKEEYILSHPNAWEGAQQTLMRRAAVQAGLVPDTPEGQARISFITEGEASLNFCVDRGLTNDPIRHGDGVTIVDAGGGTLDISTYAKRPLGNNEFEEIAAAMSFFKGSIFVTRAARRYLNDFLHGSNFYEDVPDIAEKFDKATKLSFRDPNDPQYVKFGSVRDRDPNRGIRAGQLRLDGSIIAGFFEPSIQCIVDAVVEQRRLANKPVTSVFLVGGFAASDYLFSELEKRLRPHGFDVRRPDPHLNKAVPDGAVCGYLRPNVQARVARYTYGVRCQIPYQPFNREHTKRSSNCVLNMSGDLMAPGGFSRTLVKNTQVSETQEFRSAFFEEASSKSLLNKQNTTSITCYRGNISLPEFVDQDTGNFHDVFKICADLSRIIDDLQPCTGASGARYYKLRYQIIILFGLTEFKAQYSWQENGVEKRGPAEVLFDTEIEYQI